MKYLPLLFSALFLLLSAQATAQEGNLRDINILNFRPTNDPYGIFTTDSSDRLGHLKWYVGGTLSYANNPLTLSLSDDRVSEIVAHQALIDLNFSLGLLDHFQIGIHLPLVLFQSDDGDISGFQGSDDIKSFALGDLRIVPKWTILKRAERGFGLALLPQFSIPIGTSGGNGGDQFLNFEPRLVVDYKFSSGILIALNAGYRIREAVSVANLHMNDEIYYSLGALYPLTKRLHLLGELYGAVGVTDSPGDSDSGVDEEEVPLEGVAGARYWHSSGLIFTGGVGFGLTDGYGTPRVRLFAGVGYMPVEKQAPVAKDSDGDGILDDQDQCPQRPEDKDNFEDTDGCPDLDNDQDKIPDTKDKCPLKAEDYNNFEDEDGCPDGENDRDKDGISDSKDKCPDQAEDRNGYQDEDGCPDGNEDSDKDGIPNAKDACPQVAEDKDGFEDTDGCPEPDNDHDGICDPHPAIQKHLKKYAGQCIGKDQCPLKKEIINGVKDEDGCPDKGKVQVIVKENRIVILQKIYFLFNKGIIQKRSHKLLNMVAQTLIANPQILKLRVEGHTDTVGKDAKNQKLSEKRARAVVEYLVKKGIARNRLHAVGYGESKPKQKGCTKIRSRRKRKACHAANRRVEFKILKMKKRGAK